MQEIEEEHDTDRIIGIDEYLSSGVAQLKDRISTKREESPDTKAQHEELIGCDILDKIFGGSLHNPSGSLKRGRFGSSAVNLRVCSAPCQPSLTGIPSENASALKAVAASRG